MHFNQDYSIGWLGNSGGEGEVIGAVGGLKEDELTRIRASLGENDCKGAEVKS